MTSATVLASGIRGYDSGMDKSSSRRQLARAFGPRFRLVLFFLLTWLGVAVLLVFLLNEGRREAERKAQSDALAVSTLLESGLAAILGRVQGDLDYLAATLPGDAFNPVSVGRYREALSNELTLHVGRFSDVLGFRVIDASGDFLYASNPALQAAGPDDRAYLPALAATRGGVPYFSEVALDKTSGRPLQAIAVAVRDARGNLLGGVVALLNLDDLARTFDPLALGANGVISVRRVEDARLILRRPAGPDTIDQAPVDAVLQAQLAQGGRQGLAGWRVAGDGVERIYAFRRLERYPLYVTTGLATSDYLAEWRQTSAVAGVSALLLFLSLSLVLVRLVRAEKEEGAISARLAESEARYRMLAENSHDVIWTLDIATRRYTYVSPSIAGMCGYSPEEVIGHMLDSRLTPESAERLGRDIDQRLRRIAAGDKAAGVVLSELDQVCKNGDVISTEVASSYLLDAEGVAHTILGITRNVSERKEVELALRETNRQLHARIEEIGRLQVALQELAVRDSLTGLYNRRYMDETLEREVSRARREGNPLSLVMLDIDYFKRVNDTHGHQVGDEALRMLAGILLADIRAEDVACRYGGEEFLILLPNMPLDTAIMRAQAWRGAVEGMSVSMGDFNIAFTISLGVAAYPEHGKAPDDLTRCADQALYRAKHEGRNRVSVYSA